MIKALLLVSPILTFVFLYSISIHNGKLGMTIHSLFFEKPYMLQCIPPLLDINAFRFTSIFLAIQLIFYWILPHDKVVILNSPGEEIREVNSFYSFILLILLYVLGASAGFYGGDIVYLHFNSIILIFALLSLAIFGFLLVNYHYGDGNNISSASELYFGIERNPKILDIDVKHFLRTRITFIIWPLYIISALYHQKIVYGNISRSLYHLAIAHFCYILKFHWNEDLYLNSFDSKKANFGLYVIWMDMVLHPILYTAPITVVTSSTKGLTLISNLILTFCALALIIYTNKVDRQKYKFRKSKGDMKINNSDPFFITGKYKNDVGEVYSNLLLGSGHWSKSRHPNYLGEALTFIVFSAFQGFPSILAHFPAFFVAGFLLGRIFSDEMRCTIKYQQYWLQYCSKVKYRLLPGIY